MTVEMLKKLDPLTVRPGKKREPECPFPVPDEIGLQFLDIPG
jgi:hypothetical protein